MEKYLKEPKNYDELIYLIEEFHLAEVYYKTDKEKILSQRRIISKLIDQSKIYTDFNKEYLSEMFNEFNDRVDEISKDVTDAVVEGGTIKINYKDGSQHEQKMISIDEMLAKYTKIPSELVDIAIYTLSKDMVAIGVQIQEAIIESNKEKES